MGSFRFLGVLRASKGQPHSQGLREGQGGSGTEGSAGNRKQVLTLAAAPLPPGLTCPGAAQMCSSVGVASTDGPTSVPGELEESRAPHSLPLRPPRRPHPPPGWPHPPGPREIKNSRTQGVHGVYLLLWESQEHGPVTHRKQRGQQGHFSVGSQLEDLAA